MAIEHQAFISLDECITSYIDESEQSNHKYFKLWALAFRAMSELGLDFFYTIKTVKLPVNANLTVTLPEDYLNYAKIGVLNEQGEIIPMGVNSKLTNAFDLQPTRLTQTEDNTIPTQLTQQGVWFYNYWNGFTFGNLYGFPSGSPNIGTFKIDAANGVIVLSQNFIYPYIMMEYVATPRDDQEYMVPIQFKEAIIAYLAWKDIRSTPAKTHAFNANVIMRKRDYYNERRLAIARYDPANLPDLYQWNLLSQRLTVKG